MMLISARAMVDRKKPSAPEASGQPSAFSLKRFGGGSRACGAKSREAKDLASKAETPLAES